MSIKCGAKKKEERREKSHGIEAGFNLKRKIEKMLCESFDQLKKIPGPENFSLRIRSRSVRRSI
jgi:hypothetical protein